MIEKRIFADIYIVEIQSENRPYDRSIIDEVVPVV